MRGFESPLLRHIGASFVLAPMFFPTNCTDRELVTDMAKKEKQKVETEPKPEPKKPPKVPKDGNPLLKILTILLILVGVGELALVGYYGFGVFQSNRAMRQYEAEQEALREEQLSRGTTAGSSFGPTLKVENGTVTWRREDDRPTGGTAAPSEGTPVSSQNDGEQQLARISVPIIPYLLADMGEDQEKQTATPLTDGTNTAA